MLGAKFLIVSPQTLPCSGPQIKPFVLFEVFHGSCFRMTAVIGPPPKVYDLKSRVNCCSVSSLGSVTSEIGDTWQRPADRSRIRATTQPLHSNVAIPTSGTIFLSTAFVSMPKDPNAMAVPIISITGRPVVSNGTTTNPMKYVRKTGSGERGRVPKN